MAKHPHIEGLGCMMQASFYPKPRIRIPASMMRQAQPVETEVASVVDQIEALTAKIQAAV